MRAGERDEGDHHVVLGNTKMFGFVACRHDFECEFNKFYDFELSSIAGLLHKIVFYKEISFLCQLARRWDTNVLVCLCDC